MVSILHWRLIDGIEPRLKFADLLFSHVIECIDHIEAVPVRLTRQLEPFWQAVVSRRTVTELLHFAERGEARHSLGHVELDDALPLEQNESIQVRILNGNNLARIRNGNDLDDLQQALPDEAGRGAHDAILCRQSRLHLAKRNFLHSAKLLHPTWLQHHDILGAFLQWSSRAVPRGLQ